MKVYLSPSNQPNNTYNGVATNERDNCRAIANKVKLALERQGIEVKIGLNGKVGGRLSAIFRDLFEKSAFSEIRFAAALVLKGTGVVRSGRAACGWVFNGCYEF